ncbi:tail fiber protein [Escherichia coli]|uniref:tail fiber protein n=1 Tax=Escherichia coli TaxID=562 RepID=UPI0013E3106C|nr:tail fiber protein [Escherichia coli]
MGADKTNNIMTLSSGVSQPLLADVQYFELYSSSALNRKLKNIVLPGFYCGFEPVPGTGLSVRITSENSEGKGAASVDVNNVQISVQQIEDVTVSVKAGATNIIVLEANFEHGVKTTQVESASSVSAARIYARTDNTIGQNQIELCRVIVPNGATAVTKEMIVLKYRVNRAVGVEFSNEISSTEERKAATPLAVKTLHDLVDTKAPLNSPHLSGTPTSPTPEPGTNNTQIANAAFVKAAITALINGAPGTLDTLKEIAAAINNDPNFSTTINNALALKAPLASPAFTGTPTAPTASQGTNSTQIANTAFVKAAITALINGAPGTLDTLKEIAAAINNDPNFSTTINNALALKAPLASPALTGIPTAPTAAQGTNNTQIATTAYVRAAISALVGSSPEALDTLNELAAALGNDPNFATTMTNALAGKQPLDATLTALAALATGANKLPYFTGKDTVAQTDLTSVGRDILAKTSTLAVIQYLGLRELGTSGEKIPLLSTANTWSARQTFNGGITGALTGNADTATKLKTARTIGGVAFDGSANINLPGVNTTGNQNTTGNAATATKLATARTIGGVSFDGTANINLPGVNTAGNQSTTGNAATATKLQTARKISGVAFDGSADITLTAAHVSAFSRRATGTYADSDGSVPWNAESGAYNVTRSGDSYLVANFYTGVGSCRTLQIGAHYKNGGLCYRSSRDGYGFEEGWTQIYTKKDSIPGVNTTGNQNTTGNAATATKLQTARTIGGVSFDGTANINLPGVNATGNQNTTGNAATATKLQTARTINGVSFDGSKNIELTAADLNLEQTVELAAGALQKNQNGADIPNKDKFTQTIGACRSFHGSISTGAGNWTTAQFIEWLESQWAFNHPYWMCKCSWSYGNNKIITDTGCGLIHLAGCVIEVMGNKGAMTIRVTTPSTSTGGGITNAQFTYINHGDAYAPGWRRDYNTKNLQPAFALGQTGSTVGNDKAVGWNSISGVYNANIGGASTLILHFYMGAGSCPAVQFRVNYKNGGIYYRSARDGYGFEADWSEFYTTTRKPSAGDVGAYTKAECNSRFITGIRLGTKSSVQTWNGPGWNDKSGYVVTASINSNKDELIDTTQARPVQYCINGTWYNAGSI